LPQSGGGGGVKEKKISRVLWHEFTDDELKQKALDLSATLATYDEVEEAKADAASQYGQKLKDLRGTIRKVSTAISKRGEERPLECLVVFHQPTVAAKEIFRCDTGEKIAEEAMTPAECQEHLFDAKPDFALEPETGSEKAEAAGG
jgi:hypothetical protein